MTGTNSEQVARVNGGVIRSQLAPGYWIRAVLIGLMCLALGIWGLYDYIYAIPKQEEWSKRRDITGEVKTAIEAHEDRTATNAMYKSALEAVNGALAGRSERVSPAPDEMVAITADAGWHDALEVWKSALEAMQHPGGHVGSSVFSLSRDAGTLVEHSMTAYGDAQAPSAYDRPIQWMFILSLVFVPYYIRVLMLHTGKSYQLDEDGTFHGPGGTLRADEIVDIDMGRWMSKSVAQLVDSGGKRTQLDAYIYKDLHLVVGAIAHRLHPDKWTWDAKVVKEPAAVDPPENGEDEHGQ